MVSTLQILLDHAHAKLTKTQFFSFINYSGDVSSSLVNPPIILAIEYQNVAAVQLLLSESLPTDLYLGSISNMQRNPLMMAVVGANTEIAGLLLARGGFDLNQQDAKLNTALHFACKLPTSSMVQTLIAYDNDRKINPNIKNYKGKTPLMHCSDSSDSFQKTSAMIKHFQSRLKSTLVDGRGKSALMSAIEGQTYRPTPIAWQTIQLLLKLAYNSGEMDILPKQREKQGGNTVLHAACELDHFSAHLRIIKFILEYGADVDAQNNLGFTPLMIAISCTGRGYVNREIIQTLVNDYRASLEIRNNEGMTALQIAYEKGRLDVAQFLASHLPIKPLEVEEKE